MASFLKNRAKPWRARVKVAGKSMTLGYYFTKEEAVETEEKFWLDRGKIRKGRT